MPMSLDQILVNTCYQTTHGQIRRVTSILPDGVVVFDRFAEDGKPVECEDNRMAGNAFAAELVCAVPCP